MKNLNKIKEKKIFIEFFDKNIDDDRYGKIYYQELFYITINDKKIGYTVTVNNPKWDEHY